MSTPHRLLTLVAALAASTFGVGAASAATFTVTKTADTADGACGADCSLREAVIAANSDATGDTIVLPAGTFSLTIPGYDMASTQGDLDVSQDVLIRGAGPGASVIAQRTLDRVIQMHGATTDLTLENLTVTGGYRDDAATDGSTDVGSGIHSAVGNLTLDRVVVRDNSARAFYSFGGGIFKSTGALTIRNSAIIDNHASGAGGNGGGVFARGSGITITMENVTVSRNSASDNGGGIFLNTAVPATLTHVTLTGNDGGTYGGGGMAGDLSGVRVRSSIVAGNTAATRPNCGGTVAPASDGGNVGDPGCGLTTGADTPATSVALEPMSWDPIPAFTPAAGSAAIDRAVGACPATDARGVARPQGGACDAGVAERVVPPPPPPPPAPQTITQVVTVPGPTTTVMTPAPVPGMAFPAGTPFPRRATTLRITLGCPALAGRTCTRTVRLTAVNSRRRTIVLARRIVRIAPGRIVTTSFRLTTAGRRLLAGSRRTRVTATITAPGVRQIARVLVTRR